MKHPDCIPPPPPASCRSRAAFPINLRLSAIQLFAKAGRVEPCCCSKTPSAAIKYPDGMGHNTMAKSLFEASAKALHWAEVDCQTFGTARRYRDDQVLELGVGMVPDRWLPRVALLHGLVFRVS